MKRFLLLSLSALLLSACASRPCPHGDAAPAASATEVARARAAALAADGTQRVSIDGVEIEKVEFRAGISSATVERLAQRQACRGGYGAGLLTEAGPVEVYRMACDNGKVFMAKCELRQCRQM